MEFQVKAVCTKVILKLGGELRGEINCFAGTSINEWSYLVCDWRLLRF